MEKKKGLSLQTVLTIAGLALIYLLAFLLDRIPGIPIMLTTVLRKGAIYSLVAVSMNLLNGFTGLFSLGQAGFMLVGAYTFAVLNISSGIRSTVYQYYDPLLKFSLTETLQNVLGNTAGTVLGVFVSLLLAGLLAAVLAYLIGLPVLKLKSDYLAIATLGFAEIMRAIIQWKQVGPLTNASNLLKKFANFDSVLFPFIISAICIGIIVLIINSTYGRAFKAIRDDEIAAEAMGINLAKHKMQAFLISSFFAGVGGALLAMFQSSVQANTFTSTMTYEILLIVVIGGIGSVTGSILGSFLYIACSEWWLRFLDSPMTFTSVTDTRRILFILVFAALVIGGALLLIRRERRTTKKVWKELLVSLAALALLVWLAFFIISGSLTVPLLRTGFRMVVFSVIIMIVVLFFRRGIMGDKEFSDILFARRKASGKGAVK